MGYYVTGPGNVERNGLVYGPGAEITDFKDESEVQPLINLGVISKAKPEASEVVTPGVTPLDQTLVEHPNPSGEIAQETSLSESNPTPEQISQDLRVAESSQGLGLDSNVNISQS